MLVFGTCPDKYTFPYVIKACRGVNNVSLGKWLHGLVQSLGFEDDVFVGSGFIKFYAENGCLDDARSLFDKMSQRDSVLWNVMLNGYAKDEQSVNDVVGLFREMRRSETKPNSVTYACVLSVCASETMVKFGCQLHGLVVRCGLEMDSPVANTLIAMYAKFCSLFDARKIFDLVTKADRVTWNGMIGGYVQNGYMDEALDLFHKMVATSVKPDTITFASLLPLVSVSEDIYQGKAMHGYIVRHDVSMDVFLKNAIIDMYFKCGNVVAARNIFNCSSAVDVVICTAMISGLILNGLSSDALDVFRWNDGRRIQENRGFSTVSSASLSAQSDPAFHLRTKAAPSSCLPAQQPLAMDHFGGGSWTMIPNIQTHSNPSTPSNQDNLFLQQQQQFNQPQQLYQQQQQQQQQQQRYQQQMQQQQKQQMQQQQQHQMQQQQQQQQQQHHQSLASHFHLLQLVENLADTIENGNRDQHSDALVTELKNQFEKCQQLLTSISGSISSRSMTVEGQKRKKAECEQLLNQRRDLVSRYKGSVEELINSEL
ncbi:hypothetical protein K7X08_032974 [Anisodus acutangulus]|uniref:Mediator complex subunit 9 n=1 Tax=Anisodus acutangulus TaxID=402998 RepID=A0A9Q1M2D7_9SOLA|nr:hypothetical protein K7X08_032974 [Anisodus acutangulus]